MSSQIYEFTRLRSCQRLAQLMQQTTWDFPYWPELDNDLANEEVMDFVMATIEYRQCLHGFIVREELLKGTYVVEQAQIEQIISEQLKKLEHYDLSVYTVIENIPITAGQRHIYYVRTLVMHIRHGTVNRLRAPLNLSELSKAYISEL
jgi:hypothetical protein